MKSIEAEVKSIDTGWAFDLDGVHVGSYNGAGGIAVIDTNIPFMILDATVYVEFSAQIFSINGMDCSNIFC